ncbi:MAG: MATE family efflux transporter [Lachnospiraceae bacterium]|nr:MATE family efflux transporter [Lachnospiraceae bacterium]
MKNVKRVDREQILSGNLWTVILGLAVPIVINSFIQSMYNLTDTYWLGRLGTNEMAGITLVSPVQNLILNFGTGITTAGSVLISQYLGTKKDDDARSMLSHIFLCAMIFSFGCAGLVRAGAGGICTWLGASGEVFYNGKTYLEIVVLDMPFLYTINMYTSVRQSQGDTVRPMCLNAAGVAINMILDPLLIIALQMGTAGAALATVVSKIPCAIFAFAMIRSKKEAVRLSYQGFHFQKQKLYNIAKVGLPTAIGGSTMQFGFLLITRNVNQFGATALSAYGIGNKINGLITLPSNGIGSAVATITGQNVGAKQLDRADKGYRLARNMSVVFLLVCGFILSREPVSRAAVSIFSSDEQVIDYAASFLSLMAICCFSNGIYNSTISLFQGAGHTMITMAVDASRLWVWRFAVLYFCQDVLGMGFESVWWAVVISNFISAGIIYICYRLKLWRRETVKLR